VKVVAPVGAPSAAVAGLYDEWRGYSEFCCRAEQRQFRKDQVTRRDSLARQATFSNWGLAAERGLTLVIARAEFQDRWSEQEQALELYPNKLEVE
jgi:hypothetical protein